VKLVLDSSVLLAAIARPGVCAQLLDEVTASHTLVGSRYILDEVARKLREKFEVPAAVVRDIVLELEAQAEIVLPLAVAADACRDPRDLPVLGTAAAGQAAMLITVDKDLLVLGEFQGIPIVKPGEFWKRVNH
jgi:putative PIN family toxin of toxin-antitoxin system